MSKSKFIFVSGGVISGIGKGITAATLGFLLKARGFKISMIKADPYINVDAGTMNPLEHGETFVLEDGFETDMDIGSYERFTGELFSRENSLTNGAVLQDVILKERGLGYEGRWVSMDYHVPQVMIKWFKKVAENAKADITIIEIGGTVGEIGNSLFLEANRVMKIQDPQDVLHIHLSYLPIPQNIGEMKSKPVQISVRLLNMCGINPDFLVARANICLDQERVDKLSDYCIVKEDHIICAPDVTNIYEVPINFDEEQVAEKILKDLKLKPKKTSLMTDWKKRYNNIVKAKKEVNIAVVGKYTKSGIFDLKDSYASVIEAVNHASWFLGVKPKLHWIVSDGIENNKQLQNELKKYDGVIVPQGWGSRGSEGKIKTIEIVRKNKVPYLGLCYGMQMATIEYARNVCGLKNANSEEVNKDTPYPVIHIMEHQKKLLEEKKYGGTIRLGAYPCNIQEGTILHELYKKYPNELFKKLPQVMERHRHRYEFNNEYKETLQKCGFVISGLSPDGKLVEAIELKKKDHPFFVATQYHPELKSQFLNPHPIFIGFVKAALEKQKK
ncbi:MAG TPA: CTP synthase [Candidatus Dojkabacteria bacterium]|nr:CTP synthase [Candidatus Dojkabacteria bacterium]